MPEVTPVSASVETEELDESVAAPEAGTEESAEPEVNQEEDGQAKNKGPLPRGVQKKINKLTRQKYELLEQNNQLMSRIEAIEKRLPEPERKTATPNPKPKAEDFPSHEEFLEALVDYKADQKVTARLEAERERETKSSQEERSREVFDAYNERATQAREKYDDFDEALAQSFKVPQGQVETAQTVVNAIYELENGPDVAYYLAKHPEERDQILESSALRAVAKLGTIAAKLATETTEETEEAEGEEEAEAKSSPKKVPPKPITPVKKSGHVARDDESLSPEEYQLKRLKQLAKK